MGPVGPELPPEAMAGTSTQQLPSEVAFHMKGHSGAVLAVRFNAQGSYCLSCGKDRTLRLWNPHKGILIKTYTGHGYDVRDASVSADNSQFASCGGDRQVYLWDVASGRIIRKFAGHDGVTNTVRHSLNNEVLVSGGYDKAVKVWDCRSRNFQAVQSMNPFHDSVTTAVVGATDILACSVDGTVRRFDVRMGALYTDELHHPVTSMALSHDGLCVLASCMNSSLMLLDKESGDVLATYHGHKHEAIKLDCALTPSDEFVLCGSEDGKVYIWDLVDEKVVKTIDVCHGVVSSLAIHPQMDCLLTASTHGTVTVWR